MTFPEPDGIQADARRRDRISPVEAEADDGLVDEAPAEPRFGEDAAEFFALEEQVIGPFDLDGAVRGQGEALVEDGGDAPGAAQGEAVAFRGRQIGAQAQGEVEAAGGRSPLFALASLALALLDGQNRGAGCRTLGHELLPMVIGGGQVWMDLKLDGEGNFIGEFQALVETV